MTADAPFADLIAAAPALLARLLGASGTWADVFAERSHHARTDLVVTVRGGRVSAPRLEAREAFVRGTGLRVLVGDAERFAPVDGLAPTLLHAAAAPLAADGPSAPRPVRLVHRDPPPLPLAAAERRALVERAADAALGLDADADEVHVGLREHARHVFVAGRGGADDAAAVTSAHLLTLRVAVRRRGPHGPTTAYAVHGAAAVDAFLARSPEAVAAEAVARAQRLAAASAVPAGTYPVVVGAGWGAVWMHEAVGHLLEADVHAAAPLAPLGARVAPGDVSFADDPTRGGGRGTYAADDEGAPARAVPLVADGRLVGLLADRRRGGAGHGRRQDYRHPPLPRSANLVLAPGPDDPDALVAGVADGLYVAAVAGGWVRPADDRFGFEVLEGFRIEAGRRAAPVTGVRVESSVRAALGGLDGVAGDVRLDAGRGLCRKGGQVVPVSVAAPTVRFAALDVV